MLSHSSVSEVRWLSKLYRVEDRYGLSYGTKPLNLSHWNPSDDTRKNLAPLLPLPRTANLVDYIYSSDIAMHEQLVNKIGLPPNKVALITPSGTASMLSAVNLLKQIGHRELTVLCPYYFPLAYHCRLLGIDLHHLSMERKEGTYRLPLRLLRHDLGKPALWITNPVYCTGVYLSIDDLEFLADYLKAGGTLVVDESLALPGRELAHHLGTAENFIGLYSPHKSLCINGLKFSLIAADGAYDELLEGWADVLYGPLTVTTVAAIRHFLSPDFATYLRSFLSSALSTWNFLQAEASSFSPPIDLDGKAVGHFVTCYFPTLSSQLGDDEAFLWEAAANSGATFIPGTRNHFDPSLGLNFRVNLALDSPQFRSTVTRLLRFLASRSGRND